MAAYTSNAAFVVKGAEPCAMPFDNPECSVFKQCLQSNVLVLHKAPIPESETVTTTASPATSYTVTMAASTNAEFAATNNAITVIEDENTGTVEYHIEPAGVANAVTAANNY
jgi:hypothetical protein